MAVSPGTVERAMDARGKVHADVTGDVADTVDGARSTSGSGARPISKNTTLTYFSSDATKQVAVALAGGTAAVLGDHAASRPVAAAATAGVKVRHHLHQDRRQSARRDHHLQPRAGPQGLVVARRKSVADIVAELRRIALTAAAAPTRRRPAPDRPRGSLAPLASTGMGDPTRRGATLTEITVEGFRGIGPRRSLRLTPGPGLDAGRRAQRERQEQLRRRRRDLLTGVNWRWRSDRSSVWREGWRNLHAGDHPEVSAKLAVEGEAQPVTLTRTWPSGADLGGSSVDRRLRREGQPAQPRRAGVVGRARAVSPVPQLQRAGLDVRRRPDEAP